MKHTPLEWVEENSVYVLPVELGGWIQKNQERVFIIAKETKILPTEGEKIIREIYNSSVVIEGAASSNWCVYPVEYVSSNVSAIKELVCRKQCYPGRYINRSVPWTWADVYQIVDEDYEASDVYDEYVSEGLQSLSSDELDAFVERLESRLDIGDELGQEILDECNFVKQVKN